MSDMNGVLSWSCDRVFEWAREQNLSNQVLDCIRDQEIDGKCLLTLSEIDIRDLRDKYSYNFRMGEQKKFWLAVRALQRDNHAKLVYLGLADPPTSASIGHHHIGYQSGGHGTHDLVHHLHHPHHHDVERISPPLSVDGRATSIQPEFFKTMISLGMF